MKKDEFEIYEDGTGDGVKFTLKGRVNSIHADALQEKLHNALNKGQKNIVLNMHWVEFLYSSGIRVILKAYQDTINAGGSFGIEMPSNNVKNVLGMTALDEMLIKPCAQ